MMMMMRSQQESQQPPQILTRRELEVAGLVALGLGNKHIATRLGIKVSTVKNHITSINKNLGCETRVGIAVWYVRNYEEKLGDHRIR